MDRIVNYALGVDIGGTKISLTLGDARGKILAKETLPTPTGPSTRKGIEAMAAVLLRFKKMAPESSRVLGIGVGIPGPMNPKTGIVERSPHLKGWQGFPLKSYLERKIKLPVFITNDANAAAVGEKFFGQGRGAKNFVYLTISTGVGSGIILDGKLLIGASYGAGEFGHTIVVPGGERCGCGQRGCVEAYASGTAIAKFVRAGIKKGRRFSMGAPARKLRPGAVRQITAERVALAAARRNPLALEAFRRAGHYLGIGLANLINLLNPEMLILGGSVVKSSQFFWPAMIRSTREHAWPSLYRACRITQTRLGDRVGDLGAMALVFAAFP